MGISAAMTPKERKQILQGLLDQGAILHRVGKRGSILHLKGGQQFTVPVGTSDHKARLAMRAQVTRAGYHWPLDPPEKKETTTTMPAQIEFPSDGDDYMPPAVSDTLDAPPAKEKWDVLAPYITEFAEREFWTEDLLERVPEGTSGFRDKSAGMRRLQQLLWFSGFRPTARKRNRNGYSYRWHRPAEAEWPTKFAMTPQEKMKAATAASIAKRKADAQAAAAAVAPPVVATITPAVVAAATRPLTLVKDEPEVAPAATDDDVELSLAMEMEQRAIRAERERDGVKVSLEQERRNHAATRRDLMVRIASWEKRAGEKDVEITRLRALLEERNAEHKEAGTDPVIDSVLARAKRAETRVTELEQTLFENGNERANLRTIRSLQGDVDDLTGRLHATEDELNASRAAAAALPPRVQSTRDDGWWPLEPQKGQTIDETMAGAKLFGLEVRVQARRKG